MTSADLLRVAIWQCAPLPTDNPPPTDTPGDRGSEVIEANLARLERTVAQIADRVDLVITPEMFLCGYNIGAAAVRARAERSDGPSARRVAQICADHHVAVLYGCAEESEGLVYNTIRLVDADGSTVATHYKTHLFGDLDVSMVTAGGEPAPVVDLGAWRLGMLTCYEVEFPEMLRSLAIRGADIVCVPTANMRAYDEVQQILLPARALESQVYLAYANYVGEEGDLSYGGLSEFVNPTGEVGALGGRGEEIVIATADRRALQRSRSERPYLADRRPELY